MKKSYSEKALGQKQKKSNDSSTKDMARSHSEKTFLNKLKKKSDDGKNTKSNRFLITINIFGSAGPIRFVVNEDDDAADVIEIALKVYAREGRLPVLGADINSFFLYPANDGFEALEPSEAIGSHGVRNFFLCKNQSNNAHMTEARSQAIDNRGSGWRAWLQKSLTLKISTH